NVFRAHRWQMQLEAVGKKPGFLNTLFSIFSLYFMNAVLPRLGEFYRCRVLDKYEKIPFSTSLGTVVSERIFDFLTVFAFFAIGITIQWSDFHTFFVNNFQSSYLLEKIPGTWIVAGIVAMILLIFFIRFIIMRKLSLQEHVKMIWANFHNGISSILKLNNKPLFMADTVLIWGCYFFQFYVYMFAFDFTSDLTMMNGLTLYIMGSLGVIIPVPQGIGTWHFMIINTLVMFGIGGPQAAAFALLVHATNAIMMIVLGFIAVLILPLTNK
ncbi:MAG TPA: lysylphosphatidylglycerol synthase transmembrane domain-containing protein, partial [Bacteroidales bacterium]